MPVCRPGAMIIRVSTMDGAAILILAFPWIRDCLWRSTSLKVGFPLALGDCDAPALKLRSSPGDFTSAHRWPTRRAQTEPQYPLHGTKRCLRCLWHLFHASAVVFGVPT